MKKPPGRHKQRGKERRTTRTAEATWRDNRERFFAWAKLPGAPKLPNNPYAEKPRDAMGVLAVLLN